jgi:hypothetical protein
MIEPGHEWVEIAHKWMTYQCKKCECYGLRDHGPDHLTLVPSNISQRVAGILGDEAASRLYSCEEIMIIRTMIE